GHPPHAGRRAAAGRPASLAASPPGLRRRPPGARLPARACGRRRRGGAGSKRGHPCTQGTSLPAATAGSAPRGFHRVGVGAAPVVLLAWPEPGRARCVTVRRGGGFVAQRFTRLTTHAAVLMVVIGLASYSSVNRDMGNSLLRLGVANPQARSMAQ